MATLHWAAGKRTFTVALDVNVRDTFGAASFLVDDETSQVVSLDSAGLPLTPLLAEHSYTVCVGSSAELRRQVQTMQGKLHAAQAELSRLRERHSKLAGCVAAELSHLRSLLSGTASPASLAETTAAVAAATASAAAAAAAVSFDADECAHAPAPAVSSGAGSATAAALGTVAPARHLEPESNGAWPLRPIGHLRTCFVEKNGTPRQGCVAPSSAATLKLQLGPGLNAAHALDGLRSFSHVWVLFVFHLNGNAAAKSKVHPPRLDGARVGLFATRTPHRPNPVGLSLVKLAGVRGDTLELSGIDLVNGTPVLDIKPYVPFADGHALAADALSVAPWLSAMPTPDLAVQFTPEAEAQLEALAPSLTILKSASQARAALAEVLAADPRSVHWRKSRSDVECARSLSRAHGLPRVACALVRRARASAPQKSLS